MRKLKMLDLFSGIGGISLGAEMTGKIETVGFCEIEPYPVEVLKKRWSDVPIFGDVRTLNADTLRERGITRPDIIAGGFPCQPFSVAGKRRGKEDERFLWGEFARLVHELRPRWVVGENVSGIINIAADDVLSDLEAEGYSATAFVFPASAVGAPHKRERCFFVANAGCELLPWPVQRGTNGVETGKQDAYQFERPGEARGMNWPTPTVADTFTGNLKSSQQKPGSMHSVNLSQAIYMPEKSQGQLNPDWVETLMGFDIGWTDIDCDEPTPWPGWPAPLGVKEWPTPTTDSASSRKGKYAQGGTPLTATIHSDTDQYPYEPPRTTTVSKNRAKRLKALGNAVVPQQIYPIFWAITELENA